MKKIILINAITWASLIIIGSLMLGDHPNFIYFFLVAVFCAGLMNSLLYSNGRKSTRTRKCEIR